MSKLLPSSNTVNVYIPFVPINHISNSKCVWTNPAFSISKLLGNEKTNWWNLYGLLEYATWNACHWNGNKQYTDSKKRWDSNSFHVCFECISFLSKMVFWCLLFFPTLKEFYLSHFRKHWNSQKKSKCVIHYEKRDSDYIDVILHMLSTDKNLNFELYSVQQYSLRCINDFAGWLSYCSCFWALKELKNSRKQSDGKAIFWQLQHQSRKM